MAWKYGDRVGEATVTVGSGDIMLAGPITPDHASFASQFNDGDTGPISVFGGGKWMTFAGRYNAGANSITLMTFRRSSTGTRIDLSGTMTVLCGWGAEDAAAAAAVTAAAAAVARSNIGQIEHWPTSDLRAGRLKCNGGSYSRATYPDLVTELIKTGAATFTNGSANVGMPLHGRSVGDTVKLFTAGSLATNFAAGTHGLATVGVNYFIKSVVDPNTVTLSATMTGAAIVAGSAGSGTHTWVCAPHGSGDGATTFTVPEVRGEFLRAWDNGRGIDINRAIGDLQLDALQGHYHNIQANTGGGGGLYGWGGTSTGSPGAGHANNRVLEPVTDSINGTPRVAAETRPRNVSVLTTIRFAA